MSEPTKEHFYIGWDVGAWNCDRNPKSRDAIVILNAERQLLGKWGWKNLREEINESQTSEDWLNRLFGLCGLKLPESYHVTMGIDTPLGFSEEFIRLATNLTKSLNPIEESETNPYLFRRTERFLFEKGLTPLSAVLHQIGSQATKGMHVLAKFSREVQRVGVWTNEQKSLTVIEAYPAACKGSKRIRDLRNYEPLGRDDIEDALICALVAYLFGTETTALESPHSDVPQVEGWIWVPSDALIPCS